MGYKFIENELELIQSVVEFFDKPEFWKATIGNAPRYFVHIKNKNQHYFGLSKFCAFKNITVEEYITNYRYKTNGGNTQKHIAKTVGRGWISRQKIDSEVRKAFDKWILKFHPNYTIENASFITILQSREEKHKRSKFIDPKALEEKLQLQREIGFIGEQIAIDYELNRLRSCGVKNAKNYIEHTSKINSSAGFDICCSLIEENRFIEVKSSLNKSLEFFITENEYKTLEQLGDNAFLYFVHISDLSKKKGMVLHIIKNPIKDLKTKGSLKPVAYKAIIGKKKSL
ncbi:MAG: DUF3883 domain-containing protein [Bacteroidetes bacterium]|nr:DUF3883 domain-containing protein [Bacteroidota bacterium]